MKKILFFAAALISLMASCSEEETTFTDYDKNWFVIEDNAADPAQHAAYEFYKDFGIPVFANDTIGSQERVDLWGQKYTHYQTLTLSYSMGGGLTAYSEPNITNFTYCDRNVLPSAIAWLRKEIMPLVPKNAYIHSILFVESLNSAAHGQYAFRGTNTIVIGNASRLGSMSDSEALKCKGAVLRAILTDMLFNQNLFTQQMENFGNVAKSQNESAYNLYTYGSWKQDPVTGQWYQEKPDIYALGFIGPNPSNPYYTPADVQADFLMYLETLLTTTEADFDATMSADGKPFSNYEAIMTKKQIVLAILKQLGVK